MEPSELDTLTKLVRPMPRAKYEVDSFMHMVERAIQTYVDDYGLELVPDFQRGHVWTQEQQERFIEAVIRGAVSTAGLLIQFNCASFASKSTGDLPPHMQCIDGLQRLTAIRRYVAGEIKAFGRTVDELTGTPFDVRRYMFRIAVHDFQTRADLLQYYLDLNAGGTPHSKEEIERVRALRAAAKVSVAD
jgi:hypothetical protein